MKLYEGAISLSDIKNIGYKDACKFYDYAVKISNLSTQNKK